MGLNYAMKIKKLAKAKAEILPRVLPQNMVQHPNAVRHFKNILPTLAHNQTIRFGWKIRGSLTFAKEMWKVNYFVRPLFSQSLNMYVWCRISERANAEIIKSGGFDNYLLRYPDLLDKFGLMYRGKILNVIDDGLQNPFKHTVDSNSVVLDFNVLREKYGDLYVNALEKAYHDHLNKIINS